MGREDWPKEKKWSNLGVRSEKLHRAKQQGRDYPRRDSDQGLDRERAHILFVCSKNRWRSPTAEAIFRNRASISVRSGGTSRNAKRTIASQDLQWADLIFVMEPKHKQRLQSTFPGELRYKEVIVLEIADDYRYMDPELVEILKSTVIPILEAHDV